MSFRSRAFASCLGCLAVAAALVVAAQARAGDAPVPRLDAEHRHPGGLTFRTPEVWVVGASPREPDTIEAVGGDLRVRLVLRRGEAGYDGLHANCMTELLAPAIEVGPRIEYEYDYVDRVFADRRALDSAFVVTYDEPIDGHRQWRQRNVTVVGGGQSLCAVTYAPARLWKKSAEVRALLEAILASIVFDPPR